MLPTLDPQARLSDQLVRRAFPSIDLIKQLLEGKQATAVLTNLRVRRVHIRNGSVP
jgi:hypothetical protein